MPSALTLAAELLLQPDVEPEAAGDAAAAVLALELRLPMLAVLRGFKHSIKPTRG